MHNYFAYGIGISSEIELQSMNSAEQNTKAELSIVCDKVDPPVSQDESPPFVKKHGADNYFVGIRNLANFLIEPNRITVEVLDKKELLESSLINQALPLVFMLRGYLVIRAAAVHYKNKTHLFLGYSGIGKSTVLLGLNKKGYEVLSDDFCVVNPETNTLIPSNMKIKLWEETLTSFGLNFDRLSRVREELPKYYKKLKGVAANKEYEVSVINILTVFDQDKMKLVVKRLNNLECLQYLRNNTYNQEKSDRKKADFKVLTSLSVNSYCQLIERPYRSYHPVSLVNFIESKLSTL